VSSRRAAGFVADEDAQGLVEYALILCTISVLVIVAMVFMRGDLVSLFGNIGNTVGQYPSH
jgi:Flp pilus assembly pilin Flp